MRIILTNVKKNKTLCPHWLYDTEDKKFHFITDTSCVISVRAFQRTRIGETRGSRITLLSTCINYFSI